MHLADNSETMATLLEKFISKKSLTADSVESHKAIEKKSPKNSPSKLVDQIDGASLSESAHNLESVLNAPHLYDKVYEVLPMSTSMSFFGEFNTSTPSEDSGRPNLTQSRDRAQGVSNVPKMDLSMSSSFYSSSQTPVSNLSQPVRSFLQDLRLLERRLSGIGLMPTADSAAVSYREKENDNAKAALSTSTARLNFISSRLDESFIVLPNTNNRSGNGMSPPTALNSSKKGKGNEPANTQPNPYGSNTRKVEGTNSSSSKPEDSASSSDSGYWGQGMGLFQMASKITGYSGNGSSDKNDTRVIKPHDSEPKELHGNDSKIQSERDIDDTTVQWNENSIIHPPSTVEEIRNKSKENKIRTNSWENVSEYETVAGKSMNKNSNKSSFNDSDTSKGVLRLLDTIECLSKWCNLCLNHPLCCYLLFLYSCQVKKMPSWKKR